MDWIDRHAYACRLRLLDPLHKLGLAGLGIAACLAIPHPAAGSFTALWMAALLIIWAKIPPKSVFKVITAEFFLLLFTGSSILFSVQWGTGVQGAHCLGPLCFSVPVESTRTLSLFLSRALGCLLSLNFLSLTTPVPDLLEALRRIGLPSYLIDLMGSIYRQIFILLETVNNMTTAQKSRLGYAGFTAAFSSTADLAVNLFCEVLERSERQRIALESRGFDGEMYVLTPAYTPCNTAVVLGGAYLACAACLWGGLFLSWRLGWN